MSEHVTEKKSIGLYSAIALIISNMIGVGVFTSLGYQVVSIQSGWSILFLWLLGGIAALTGALCYGEVGSMYPQSGGEYNYLSKIYHPIVGFISGWISVFAGFAAPIAASCLAFSGYFTALFPSVPPILVSVIILVSITSINLIGVKAGVRFQNIFTFINIGTMLFIILAGLTSKKSGDIDFSFTGSVILSDIFSSSYAVSFFFVSLAYSGWNAASYIAGELKDVKTNLPKALVTGTILVSILYLLVNFTLLHTSPVNAISGKPEVGLIASYYIFGKEGSFIMGAIICLLLCASINSMTIAGPRVANEIGSDFRLFKFMGIKSKKDSLPFVAIIIQSSIALFFILSSKFEAVITYISFTLNLFVFLVVLGLIVLRIKKPEMERTFKVPFYPITPFIFLSISAWLMVYGFKEKPLESILGLITASIGALLFYIDKKVIKERG